jgi:hypothetical protein
MWPSAQGFFPVVPTAHGVDGDSGVQPAVVAEQAREEQRLSKVKKKS